MGDNLNGIFANMIQGMGFIGCAPNRVYNMAPPDGGGVEATAEGTDLSLHSAAAPLTALTLYGKSEQETTTGAQLFDFVSDAGASQTQNGVTITNNGDGSFIVTGTPTITEGIIFTFYFTQGAVIPDGDYYTNVGARITRKDGSDYFPGSGGIFSFSAETDEYIRFYWQKRTQNYVDGETIWPMLNSGSTALPWEPYTGGARSPSPDYPQEIKSVGDSGTINVTLSDGGSQSQTLPVQTSNGLPGIPVSSSGNYTDANGQQWVCDEIDLARGKYVQRNCRLVLDGSEVWSAGYNENAQRVFFRYLAELPYKRQSGGILCTAFLNVEWGYDKPDANNSISFASDNVSLQVSTTLFDGNVEEFKDWLTTNPMTVVYTIATHIETPLSPSELSAYAALRTYSPTTVVSNDAGAWMKVGYKATPQPMTMLARKR